MCSCMASRSSFNGGRISQTKIRRKALFCKYLLVILQLFLIYCYYQTHIFFGTQIQIQKYKYTNTNTQIQTDKTYYVCTAPKCAIPLLRFCKMLQIPKISKYKVIQNDEGRVARNWFHILCCQLPAFFQSGNEKSCILKQRGN